MSHSEDEETETLGSLPLSPIPMVRNSYNYEIRGSFGTPIERRIGRPERATQLGLSLKKDFSFDLDQTFPKAMKPRKPVTPEGMKSLHDFKGENFFDICYSTIGGSRGSFTPTDNQQALLMSMSLDKSWAFFNYIGCMEEGNVMPVQNPNKAVAVINARSTEILMVNDVACELLMLSESDLVGSRLSGFLRLKDKRRDEMTENIINKEGHLMRITGKVLEAVNSNDEATPVCVWMSKQSQQDEPTCVVVMEPVELITAHVKFDAQGIISDCDSDFKILFGVEEDPEVSDQHMRFFIPSIRLPKEGLPKKDIQNQKATGLLKDRSSFPLSLRLDETDGESYSATVWVYVAISGMLTILSDGRIHSCNENFSQVLFGYEREELLGRKIDFLIPEFFEEIFLLTSQSQSFRSSTKASPAHRKSETSELIEEAAKLSMNVGKENQTSPNSTDELLNQSCGDLVPNDVTASSGSPEAVRNRSNAECDSSPPTVEATGSPLHHLAGGGDGPLANITLNESKEQLTSTPAQKRQSKGNQSRAFEVEEGSFSGYCLHRDGSKIAIVYQVCSLELQEEDTLYCIWISRDLTRQNEMIRDSLNLTHASADLSGLHDISARSDGATAIKSLSTSTDEGTFDARYETRAQIGKGAFGFVKLATRRTDGREVVVKFIKKHKIGDECWIEDDQLGRVPAEIALLSQLDHPNIVKVIDVFENTDFYQMIMEKHGDGMDLFEFIDREPDLHSIEPLASYIFRQIVDAVEYLHSLNICHRDIKDENIIIDRLFSIQLIDFGSAAFMGHGKQFISFAGTMEYCSPEVLLGNHYAGPELEMWSLGVTLYTLVFSENPFFDADQTITCVLRPPSRVSKELMYLISLLLHPDPKLRATITDVRENFWTRQPVKIQNYNFDTILPNSKFEGNVAADNRNDSVGCEEEEPTVAEDLEERALHLEQKRITSSLTVS